MGKVGLLVVAMVLAFGASADAASYRARPAGGWDELSPAVSHRLATRYLKRQFGPGAHITHCRVGRNRAVCYFEVTINYSNEGRPSQALVSSRVRVIQGYCGRWVFDDFEPDPDFFDCYP